MSIGMNREILAPQERCASTSNRNFEGRQGAGGRTHLMSPAMAAAAAIVGNLADVRKVASSLQIGAHRNSPKIEVAGIAHSADIEDDADLERIADVPQDSQDPVTSNDAPSSTSAGIPPFTQLRGITAYMSNANVDTDALIPKQFLKTIKRSGLGSALFYEWRFDPKTGEENKDFILNQEPYRKSSIMVCTGPNFGCGSSREHAPWAFLDFGIWCVIAPSFGDIFFNNCFKNGILPIRIQDQAVLENI